MATLAKPRAASRPPALQPGDVLSRVEFERRYAAMPNLKRAELIEGIVYLSPPVRADFHGIPHSRLGMLIQFYATKNPNLIVADNTTVRIDNLNELQPDLLLMRKNGQAHMDADGYICGAPELVAEIASSSAAYDLHQKKRTYQRAGVLEYLVWLADENRLVWFHLTEGEFVEIPPAADGSLVSREFPGLVIDAPALTSGDLVAALARLE